MVLHGPEFRCTPDRDSRSMRANNDLHNPHVLVAVSLKTRGEGGLGDDCGVSVCVCVPSRFLLRPIEIWGDGLVMMLHGEGALSESTSHLGATRRA